MSKDKDNRPSRLERQMAILGLGSDSLPEESLTAERQAMAETDPRPLVFPESVVLGAQGVTTFAAAPGAEAASRLLRHKRAYITATLGGLVAACAAFFVLRQGPIEPPLQVMGGGDVRVFSEVGGTVQAFVSNTGLPTGARVKAEVLASVPSVAFWGVVARDGRLLSDPAWIVQNRLDLAVGERRAFKGSLALEGPSEGESLIVVTCPAATTTDLAEVVARSLAAKLPEALRACRTQRFLLRR